MTLRGRHDLYDRGVTVASESAEVEVKYLFGKDKVILGLSPNWESTALDAALFLSLSWHAGRQRNRFKHILYMSVPSFANFLIV